MFPWNDDQLSVVSRKNKPRKPSLLKAGSHVIENTKMTAAGVKKMPKFVEPSMNDLFTHGVQGQAENEKNSLRTLDINGGVKKNRFGAIMKIDNKLANQIAGTTKNVPKGRNSSSIVFGD